MPRLEPAESYIIPVHPATEGHDVHRLAVERHVFPAPKSTKRSMAFLWSHSNGFNKETLHPTMREFVKHLRNDAALDETSFTLVAWEARNHGDSARLNADKLRSDYTWFDNVMDTLQVVEQLELKKKYDCLIGVGHSFGATSMLVCEFFHPKTFDGLCLIEPVIRKTIDPVPVRAKYPTMATKKRRDTWPSREECLKQLAPRPFWKRFDPEVLQLYVDYGMYETTEGTIALKTPKMEEFRIFDVQSYANITGYSSLRSLSIPVHIIYALGSDFLKPENKEDILEKSQQITLEFVEGSHMVPNEKPKDMAPHIAQIVERVLSASPRAKL
ncbi:Alpha/Beta hydrolase protein [Syncephalastrum racemosum]|uniref:Alpha/Beta hydrolase protein n=1 Tax=Syncephalastrum racemosum TaxID=13706 RepID=A0A1X2HNT7_SYNRA|nr:Alpha/Beta hydrolase protein [Syncephalastrum racemosum]